ncbi:MAG: methylmalonyl Co-A mutase-associated GTPase MeaB [Anaerolineales bacterium]|nr:methylmalonyl Co-A mutase-associated GTPase MeaB [Anaerolineales bacterium]
MTLSQAILNGERLALARLLTQVENDTPQGRAALIELFPHTGKAHLVGVTGSPGAGKSSLVNQLALQYRKSQEKRVAIIAVDPSSPFTGGAVLGDRVRMRDLFGDPNIFIRSMASRGSLGGLAQTTANLVQVFDAAGFDVVIVETVGAGQSEVDIVRLAHTTVVVEAPGLGDDIQALKAGIMEIADVLVVNKADRPGVENTEKALKSMLELSRPTTKRTLKHHGTEMTVFAPQEKAEDGVWTPPIQRTIAFDGTGVPELLEAIERHADYLRQSGGWQRRERARLDVELQTLIRAELLTRFREALSAQAYEKALEDVVERKMSPWQAAQTLLKEGAR